MFSLQTHFQQERGSSRRFSSIHSAALLVVIIVMLPLSVNAEQDIPGTPSQNQTHTAYWKYAALAPPAAIRDIIDLPFRVAVFPFIALFELTDAGNIFDPNEETGMFFYLAFPLSFPGTALVGINSGLVFWLTDNGFANGCRRISQPFSYGAGLFPNIRSIDFHPPPDIEKEKPIPREEEDEKKIFRHRRGKTRRTR